MMKRFEKIGKIAGLMLLALAFVFAGCQGAGDSSSSGGGAPAIGTDSGVQIAVDPSQGFGDNVNIGETGLSESTTVDGHVVELMNDGTPNFCPGDSVAFPCPPNPLIVKPIGTGGGDVQFWLKLINRDPELAMTNVMMDHAGCINCTSATFDNSDFCGAPGDTCVRNGYDPPVPTSIDGSGFCFAEVGRYIPILQKPFNQYGCNLNPCPNFSSKPVQVIHPKCGQESVLYDFASQTELYTFWGSVSADYVPWNPVGTDGIPGTGDDDARYDFQNYTTIYLILADFAGKAGASTLYPRGSYQRSNVLAGYGAPGMRSGYTAAADSYFSVNVAIEYPDRIETNVMGDPFNFNAATGYEYYGTYAAFFRWDPTVLDIVTNNKGALGIFNTFREPCYIQTECYGQGKENYTHLVKFDLSIHGQINKTNGYIFFYRQIAGNFGQYLAPFGYVTNNLGVINIMPNTAYTQYVNAEGGHKGVAKLNHAYAGGILYGDNTNFRIQDGVDPDPEQNLLNFHFWVRPGTSGKGSAIKVDSFAGYTVFIYSHTGLNFYPSGTGEVTDWSQFCAPFSAGYGNSTNQWCDPGLGQSDYAIYQGTENQKANLPEMGGEAVQGGLGGPQNWSVYVCVQ